MKISSNNSSHNHNGGDAGYFGGAQRKVNNYDYDDGMQPRPIQPLLNNNYMQGER